MIQVIVIDDEEIIRRGIANKLRRLVKDANIVAEAADGEEGLALTEQFKPDIVITDIKMPKIEGLHFIKQAQEISPSTRFIIISGYEDFSFARQAVRLGVSDYLLKPVDNDELVKAMNGLRDKILREKESAKYISDLNDKASGSVILKKNRLLDAILKGEIAAEEAMREKLAEIGYSFRYDQFSTMSIQIQNFDQQLFPDEKNTLLRFAIANVFEESMSDVGVCIAFEDGHPHHGVCAVLNHRLAQSFVIAAIQKAVDEVRQYLEAEIYVGVGPVCARAEDIAQSFKQAIKCARQKLVFPEKAIILFADYEEIRKNNYVLGEEERRVIVSLLSGASENSMRELVALIDSIFERMRDLNVPFQKVKELCMDILLITVREIKEKNSYLYEQLSDIGIESYFEDCRFLDDFRDRICSVLRNLSMHFEQENLSGGKKIVAAIRKKMEEEFYLDLKLSTFANSYYINQSYLSSLFLQETGRNFSQFLTDIRVRKAKEFLQKTELPVSKVSELVGYNDRSYFCSVFQKAVGLSPAKYRLQGKETDNENR